jgi:acyl carrier protein
VIAHGVECPGVVWGEPLTLCPGGGEDCPGATAERAQVIAEGGPDMRPAVLGGECARCFRGGGAHETTCPKVERLLQVPHFAAEIECVHCGADVDIPLRTFEGREDHWLFEDETLRCEHCGGANHVMVDDGSAYFATCDDPCPVCDVLRAVEDVLDRSADLDTPAGDSLQRAEVEMAVEEAMGVDIPEDDRGTWRTPRELAAIVERVKAERWCFACATPKSERRCYSADGVRVEWYCRACENTALWRLGRSVGK